MSHKMLSIAERRALDDLGFLNLGILLSSSQLEAILQRTGELLATEGERAGCELLDSPNIRYPKEQGADRLADLVNKGSVFDVFHTHPRLLDGVSHILGGQFKLSSLNYRAAKPASGEQRLHVDWHQAVAPGSARVCNSIWLLDDFTELNGATRVIPGSHLAGKLPQDVLDDPLAPHPDEILLQAPAGTVFLLNAHTWHGGTLNRTVFPRRAIHSYFCHSNELQQLNQAKYLRPETANRLSVDQLRLIVGPNVQLTATD
ncbi:MAG: phytanoyl-CoA dioxygenase family protein [Planctomycetales bacterium]|nr:phytanoyl-CoA dioxygenase family protein [Planctomycetales bacterium]